jgi:phage tail sheath gpL-like
VNITVRGDGGAVYASVIAEAVVADAGAAEEMLDARPMATAAINAITAPPRDRITRTRESCRINRPRHSENAECYRAGTVGTAVVFG